MSIYYPIFYIGLSLLFPIYNIIFFIICFADRILGTSFVDRVDHNSTT